MINSEKLEKYIIEELVITEQKINGQRESFFDKKALGLKQKTLLDIQDIINKEHGKNWVNGN